MGRAGGGSGPVRGYDAAPPPPPPPPPPADPDPLALLTELGRLHEAGTLTDEEFAAQKARILAQV